MKAMEKPETTATLSVAQAAEVLGMSRSAVYAAIVDGRLPARKWGDRVLLLRSELERFLNGLPVRRATVRRDARDE
jgi:excisionase family DNA binding protein